MVTHDDHNDGSDSPYYPRIILCIPGPWEGRDDLAQRLLPGGLLLEEKKLRRADGSEAFDAEFRGPDARMRSAFQASACRLRPSLTPGDFHAIQNHRSVLYVLSDPFGRTTAAAAATRMIDVGRALIEAGGIAVKCDSSGIAHSAERWRSLNLPIFEAFVRLPIVDEIDDLYSVGMHLLGLPDGIVSLKDFPRGDLSGALRVLEEFLRSQAPPKGFAASPEPCTGYAPDEFFWNRWGRLRLRPDPIKSGADPGLPE
jgi:hypothetical protein